MPDKADHNKRAHPIELLHRATGDKTRQQHIKLHPRLYAELRCKSNFSFLRGASHPEELARRAAELGYAALASLYSQLLATVLRRPLITVGVAFALLAASLMLIPGL